MAETLSEDDRIEFDIVGSDWQKAAHSGKQLDEWIQILLMQKFIINIFGQLIKDFSSS